MSEGKRRRKATASLPVCQQGSLSAPLTVLDLDHYFCSFCQYSRLQASQVDLVDPGGSVDEVAPGALQVDLVDPGGSVDEVAPGALQVDLADPGGSADEVAPGALQVDLADPENLIQLFDHHHLNYLSVDWDLVAEPEPASVHLWK